MRNRKQTPFIKSCLSDILDVLDGKELKQRFEDYLSARNYYNKDFLLLYTCLTPETFWKELQDYFGADFTRQHQEAFRQEQKSGNNLELAKGENC